MGTIKIVSWNVEHLEHLIGPDLSAIKLRRREAIAREIHDLSPDIFCLLEGPKGEEAIAEISMDLLNGEWLPVLTPDHDYATRGSQWIWFLVRSDMVGICSLLPCSTWDAFAGRVWKVHYWGVFAEETHRHYRHPQVLVIDWNGLRVEIIGLHLKSKFVNQGKSMWQQGGEARDEFIQKAMKARVKMATEAVNVRAYIDARFNQTETPAIFVLGDLNDGPGKEYFENQYLFFDLVSNVQGDIFSANKFLNHVLFDFPGHLRWSVCFEDFIEPGREPRILLDHIFYTQGLGSGRLPWQVVEHAGKIEHEIHDLVNATLPASAKTSDHKPVSVTVTTAD